MDYNRIGEAYANTERDKMGHQNPHKTVLKGEVSEHENTTKEGNKICMKISD